MAASSGPNLGVSYGWAARESGWNAGMDANLKLLDAVLQLSVKSRAVAVPPGTPANGDRGCLSLLALMHELGTSRATLLRATPFSVWRCSGPLFAAILLPERAISIFWCASNAVARLRMPISTLAD